MRKMLIASLLALCLPAVSHAIEISVAAHVMAPSCSLSVQVQFIYTVVVSKVDSPSWANEGIRWQTSHDLFNCLPHVTRNIGFCCVSGGNRAILNNSHEGVPCPVRASCETFATIGGGLLPIFSDSDFSSCREPCLDPFF